MSPGASPFGRGWEGTSGSDRSSRCSLLSSDAKRSPEGPRHRFTHNPDTQEPSLRGSQTQTATCLLGHRTHDPEPGAQKHPHPESSDQQADTEKEHAHTCDWITRLHTRN